MTEEPLVTIQPKVESRILQRLSTKDQLGQNIEVHLCIALSARYRIND